MSAQPKPYEVGWRFRIKGRHGDIVGIQSRDPLIYIVQFDGDVVYKPTKKNPDAHVKVKREVAHEDITELMQWCQPEWNMVAVDPEVFAKMKAANGASDLPAHGFAFKTKDAKANPEEGTAIEKPVLWQGRYWISEGSGCAILNDGRGWYDLPLTVFPLIPLAEYTGALRAPSKLFEGYGGFLVTCELGKFVVEDKPVTVYPSERIYHKDDDIDNGPDRIPQVKKRTTPRNRPRTPKTAKLPEPVPQAPYQLTFGESK